MTDARTVLAALRDGEPPSADDLRWFAAGLASGAVTDAQAGAFAMAVCTRGLGEAGRVALTLAMRDSGHRLTWDLPGPVVDKHSTGGIGDCVSLLLAPVLACAGAFVPMISGRGLGHTGGTLDKLEAIPGLRVELSEAAFRAQVAQTGCAIVAASGDLAPADRRLYAVRDVTGTVESVDLITASILSKKLAAGLGALVLDVKTGSGAFMATEDAAATLARALVDTATGAGCPTRALLTDMSQPLAPAAGNAVEIAEVIRALTGGTETPLLTLTAALCGEVLALSGLAASPEDGTATATAILRDGRAAEGFARMVAAQGGPRDILSRDPLPQAPVIRPVRATQSGIVRSIDGRALGTLVVHLGGGRLRDGDRVDPRVGLSGIVRIGASVMPGAPLATVHAADADALGRAADTVRRAIALGPDPVAPPPLIRQRIGA